MAAIYSELASRAEAEDCITILAKKLYDCERPGDTEEWNTCTEEERQFHRNCVKAVLEEKEVVAKAQTVI